MMDGPPDDWEQRFGGQSPDGDVPDVYPHNIEAEQAVLGALLLDNDLMHLVPKLLEDHFYAPEHALVFKAIKHLVDKGRTATPITLKSLVGNNPLLKDVRGPEYLARLAGSATSIRMIRDYAEIVMDLWAQRMVIRACQDATDMLHSDPITPVSTVMSDLETQFVEVRSASQSKPAVITYASATMDALDAINEAYKGEGAVAQSSGLTALDDILGGLFDGETTILAGRPSMGKTTAGLAMAAAMARPAPATGASLGAGVVVASCEMTVRALMQRHMSATAYDRGVKVEYSRLRKGDLTEGEMRTFLQSRQDQPALPIRFVGQNNGQALNTVLGEIKAAARAMPDETPLRAVMIDYLGLLRVPGFRFGRTQEVGVISSAVKELAKELDVPVILLSQLSRAVENRPIMQRRPVLSDLRDSGDVEQDADNVVFVYRDAHYLAKHLEDPEVKKDFDLYTEIEARMNRCSRQMELIVAKNRNGPLGTARVFCDLPFNAVRDLTDDPRQINMEGFS